MVIIAGLGNPGKEYENTRHNAGFLVIDRLAQAEGISVNNAKHRALVGKGVIGGQQVLLVKPQTYMNLSGESIGEIMNYYHLDPETELIVISDDIAQEVGGLRIRKKGSAGGHNGLKNIIAHLGTENFPRVRVGVGEKPAGGDLVKHVLGRIDSSKQNDYEKALDAAVLGIKCMLSEDIDTAMNRYNINIKKEK